MTLLHLPSEILQDILEHALHEATKPQLYRYRLVNRCFETHMNQLSWKKRCWFSPTTMMAHAGLKNPRPFAYSKNCDVEHKIRTMMSKFLLSSLPVDNAVQHGLRLAMAVLMNTKELIIQETCYQDFKDLVHEDDGLLETYTDPESRKRFLKIVDLLVETTLYVSGPELKYLTWYPERCIDGLPGDGSGDWDSSGPTDFYSLNLDWALAAAVMINDTPTIKSILRATKDFNGHVMLSDTLRTSITPSEVGRYWNYQDDGPAWANALAVAVRKGNYELATLLMDNYMHLVNAYTTVPPHESALEIACQRGSFQMVDLILDPCRGLDYTSWHAFYAVQMAARCPCVKGGPANCEERIAIIQLLLDLQSPERDCQKLKNEVLRQACKWGCMAIVRTLVEDIGAEPASFDEMALGCAATHGHIDVMEYLLERDTGHLSLFFAVYDIEFVEVAADRDMMEHLEKTNAFILADGPLEPVKAQYLLTAAKARGCTKVVELLTRGGLYS